MTCGSFRVPTVCEAIETQKNPRHAPCLRKSNRTAVALCRASTSCLPHEQTWMPATSAGMTGLERGPSAVRRPVCDIPPLARAAAIAYPPVNRTNETEEPPVLHLRTSVTGAALMLALCLITPATAQTPPAWAP